MNTIVKLHILTALVWIIQQSWKHTLSWNEEFPEDEANEQHFNPGLRNKPIFLFNFNLNEIAVFLKDNGNIQVILEKQSWQKTATGFCNVSSQSLFRTLSQRVGMMELSCVTPTQQQRLLSLHSQSTDISVASVGVRGFTHKHIPIYSMCWCVFWGC